ncbi:MAG: hypothetical protein ABI663_21270 [Chryseolinea sp.]
MESTTEQNRPIAFHLGNPESIQVQKEIEVHAFHARIKKIMIDSEELEKNREVEKVKIENRFEQEEEIERTRREEEVHPDTTMESCL